MFHVHNDYIARRNQTLRVMKRVADLQLHGTTPKRLEGLFLQLFITHARRLRNTESQQPKVGPLRCD